MSSRLFRQPCRAASTVRTHKDDDEKPTATGRAVKTLIVWPRRRAASAGRPVVRLDGPQGSSGITGRAAPLRTMRCGDQLPLAAPTNAPRSHCINCAPHLTQSTPRFGAFRIAGTRAAQTPLGRLTVTDRQLTKLMPLHALWKVYNRSEAKIVYTLFTSSWILQIKLGPLLS